MSKSNRFKLLIISLLIAIVSFAFACTTPEGGQTGDVVLDNYVNNSWEKVPQRYGDILLDGVLDDTAWEKQNKLIGENLVIGAGTYNVESSAYFADNGVVMYFKVQMDTGVYVNTTRGESYNTGVEIYINAGGTSSLLNNAWEIPINANMEYFPRLYFQAGANEANYGPSAMAMDIATTIDGVDNVLPGADYDLSPEESGGFIVEAFLPWSGLGANGALSSIKYDFAILHLTDYAGEGEESRIWRSFHDVRDGGEGIHDINNRYTFNNRGYVDETVMGDERVVTLNGEPVTRAQTVIDGGVVNVNIGKIGTEGNISLVPDTGYRLENFVVNGRKVYETSFHVGSETGDVKIVAEFAPLPEGTDYHNFSIDVLSVKGAPIGCSDLTGKHLVLESALGYFSAEIDADGVANFAGIPVGKYSLGIEEVAGIDVDFNVTTALTTEEINLEFKPFTTNSAFSTVVGAEKFDFTVSGSSSYSPTILPVSSSVGDIVWAQMKLYAPDLDANNFDNSNDVLLANFDTGNVKYGLWYLGEDADGDNAGTEGQTLYLRNYLRTTNSWDKKSLGNSSDANSIQSQLINDGKYIELAYSYSNGLGYLLYRVEGATDWSSWKTISANPLEAIATDALSDRIVDFKYATASSARYAGIINTAVSTVGSGTAKAYGTVYNGDVIVVPTASAGEMVYDVTVNGMSYPEAVAKYNNGITSEIVISGVKAWNVDVVVTFGGQTETTNYSLSLIDAKGNRVNGDAIFVANQGYSPMASVINGNVSVDLAKGTTYTISVNGYNPATVTVDAEGYLSTDTITLKKSLLSTSNRVWQYGYSDEDGYWATTDTVAYGGDNMLYVGEQFTGSKVLSLDVEMEIAGKGNKGHYPGVAIIDEAGVTAYYQFINSDDWVKFRRAGTLTDIASLKIGLSAGDEFTGSFKIYVDGKTIILTDADDNLLVSEDVTVGASSFRTACKIAFFYEADTMLPWKFSNITLEDVTFDYVDLKAKTTGDDDFTAATNGKVSANTFTLTSNPTNIVAGTTISITVTPIAYNMDNYYITNILVNGAKVAYELNSTGKATINYAVPAGTSSLEVEVTTAVAVPATANITFYKKGLEGKTVLSNESITFNGESVTLANGVYAFTGNSGNYTASLGDENYHDVVITINERGDYEAIFNLKVLKDDVNVDAINGNVVFEHKGWNVNTTIEINKDVFDSEIVYAELTANINTSAATDDNAFIVGFEMGNTGAYPVGIAVTGGAWVSRISTDLGGWHEGRIRDYNGKGDVFVARIAVVYDPTNKVMDLYVSDDNTGVLIKRVSKTDSNFTGITKLANYVGNSATITGLKLATSVPTDSFINYQTSDAYTVSGPATVAKDGTATITVTPNAGYAIKNVDIPGAVYTTAPGANGAIIVTLNNANVINSTYKVSVVTGVANGSATITIGSIKNYNGLDATNVNVKITIGSIVKTATVVDGVANFTGLVAGEYTISVDGYLMSGDTTFTVVDGGKATPTVSGQQHIFTKANTVKDEYSDAFTYTYSAENGYSVTALPPGNSQVRARFDESIVGTFNGISLHYSSNNTGTYHFPMVTFVDENGNLMGYQFCQWNNALQLKAFGTNGDDGKGSYPGTSLVTLYNTPGQFEADVTFYFVEGSTVGYLFENVTIGGVAQPAKSGSYDLGVELNQGNQVFDGFGTAKSAVIIFNKESDEDNAGPWSFSNFKFFNGKPSVAIETATSDLYTISIADDKTTANMGEEIAITVTPVNANVTVVGLTVNGTTYSVSDATFENGAYTFTYVNSSAVNKLVISAEATDEVFNYALSVPYVITWGEDQISANGLTASLTRVGGTDAIASAEIDADGVANFTGVPMGTYNVAVDNKYLSDTTVTVDTENTSGSVSDLTLSVVHYADSTLDTSDILNGNVSLTSAVTTSQYIVFDTNALGDIKYAQMTLSGTLSPATKEKPEGWYAGFRNNGGSDGGKVYGPYHSSVLNYNANSQKYSYGLRFVANNHDNSITDYDELQYRYGEGSWEYGLAHSFGTQNVGTVATNYEVENFSIIWLFKDGKTYAYGAYGNESFKLVSIINSDLGSFSVLLLENFADATITNLYVSNTVPTDLDLGLTNDDAKGSATARGNFFGDVTINVAPITTATADAPYGYDIGRVLVNGVDVLTNTSIVIPAIGDKTNDVSIPVTVVNGENCAKTFTLNGWNLPYMTVVVDYVKVEAPAVDYTFDITAKFAEESDYSDLHAGTTVVFEGANGNNATAVVGADGSVVATLYPDTYTVSVENGSFTIELTGDNSAVISQAVDLAWVYTSTETTPVTKNADNTLKMVGSADDGAAKIVLYDGDNAGGKAFSWNHTVLGTVRQKYPGNVLKFTFANGKLHENNLFYLDATNDDGARYRYKSANSKDFDVSSNLQRVEVDGVQYSGFVDIFEYIIIADDGMSYTYYGEGNKCESYVDFPDKLVKIELVEGWYDGAGIYEFNNVRRYSSVPQVGITYTGDNFTFYGASSVDYYGSTDITVTTDDDYAVDNVTATGAIVSNLVRNSSGATATITATGTSDIVVNVATYKPLNTSTVNLTLTGKTIGEDGIESANIEGLTATISKDALSFNAEIIDGIATFVEVPDGNYTITVDNGRFEGANEFTVVYSDGTEDVAVDVNENVFTSVDATADLSKLYTDNVITFAENTTETTVSRKTLDFDSSKVFYVSYEYTYDKRVLSSVNDQDLTVVSVKDDGYNVMTLQTWSGAKFIARCTDWTSYWSDVREVGTSNIGKVLIAVAVVPNGDVYNVNWFMSDAVGVDDVLTASDLNLITHAKSAANTATGGIEYISNSIYHYGKISNLKLSETVPASLLSVTATADENYSISVPDTVNYGSQVTVTVTPKVDTILLNSITVVGGSVAQSFDEKTGVLTALITADIPNEDIVISEVSYTLASQKSIVNLTLTGKTIGATGIESANLEGLTATISKDALSYTATITGGIASFAEIPNGDYTITVDNYSSATFEVAYTGEVINASADLEYKLFKDSESTNTNYAFDYDTNTLTFTDDKVYAGGNNYQYVLNGNYVYAEITVTVNEQQFTDANNNIDVYEFGFVPQMTGAETSMQFGLWNDHTTYKWREMIDWKYDGSINGIAEKDVNVTVIMAMVIKDGVGYMYMTDANQTTLINRIVSTEAGNKIKNSTFIKIDKLANHIGKYATVTNIKLSETVPVDAITYDEEANFTYGEKPSTLGFKEEKTFTVTPAEGYYVKDVTATNATVTKTYDEGTGVTTVTLIDNTVGFANVNVSVIVEQEVLKGTYTYNLTWKFAEDDVTPVALVNKTITFKSANYPEFTATTNENGAVTVELYEGEWTIVSGNMSANVDSVANEVATQNIVLVNDFEVVKDTNSMTYSKNADGTYNYRHAGAGNTNSGIILYNGGASVANTRFSFDVALTGTSYPSFQIRVKDVNGKQYQYHNMYILNNEFVTKYINEVSYETSANPGEFFTVVYEIAEDAKSIRAYVNGTWLGTFTHDAEINYIRICKGWSDGDHIAELKNIRRYNTLENCTFVVNGEHITTTDTSAVALGAQKTITITADAGYKLESVTVDGAKYTSSGDSQTVELIITTVLPQEIVINVTTSVETTKYAVNYTFKNDGETNPLDWGTYVPVDTNVTVKSGDTPYAEATIGENGAFAVELENGSYTIAVGDYRPFSIEVASAEISSEQKLVYNTFTSESALVDALAAGTPYETKTANPDFTANVVYAEMTIYHPTWAPTDDKGGAGFKSGYTDGSSGNFEIQKSARKYEGDTIKSEQAFYARACFVDNSCATGKSINSDYVFGVYNNVGYTVAMAIVNGRATLFGPDANGNLIPVMYDSIKALDATKVRGLHVCLEGTIVDIKTYTTLDNEYVQSIINADGDAKPADFSLKTPNTYGDVMYFDADANTEITFDFTFTSKTGDRFFPYVILNGGSQVQFCAYDGALHLKPNAIENGQVTAATPSNGIQTITFKIKADGDGRMAYYKVVDSQDTFLGNFTAYGSAFKSCMMKSIFSVQFFIEGIESYDTTGTQNNEILKGNPFAFTNVTITKGNSN